MHYKGQVWICVDRPWIRVLLSEPSPRHLCLTLYIDDDPLRISTFNIEKINHDKYWERLV